jgi:hypothetical protein
LSANVAFPDSFKLPFSHHMHRLISTDSPPRRLETEEGESGIDSPFDEPMVLLDYVIEVFALSELRGIWCNFSREGRLSLFSTSPYAASTASHTCRIMAPWRVISDVSNCPFLILFASSIPLNVTCAFPNALNPSQHRVTPLLHLPVILLNQVVQVLVGPDERLSG